MQRLLVAAVLVALTSTGASAASYSSAVSLFGGGGTLIDFEGQPEGTLISNQFSGVTFSQFTLGGGRPQIDNSPFLFAYVASSGVGVLTGSLEGGHPFPTVAGLQATFGTGQSAVELFLSDSAPLGTYTVDILGAGDVILETLVILAGDIAPGRFVGFTRGSADILAIRADSAVENDAFSWDDVRFNAQPSGIPLPGTLLLLGAGLVVAAAARRVRKS